VSGTIAGAPFHGSGFVIALDRGVATIVTASHVIEGASTLEVTFAADPMRSFPVSRVVSIEPKNQNGLAVFVVQGDVPGGVRPLQLAEGVSDLSPGDSAFLIGYPQNATGTAPRTLTRSFSRRDGSRYEFDGGVEGGISGGPVVAGGRAVGVITETDERYSYAVPIAILREFLLGSGVSLSSESTAASNALSTVGPPASRRVTSSEERVTITFTPRGRSEGLQKLKLWVNDVLAGDIVFASPPQPLEVTGPPGEWRLVYQLIGVGNHVTRHSYRQQFGREFFVERSGAYLVDAYDDRRGGYGVTIVPADTPR
jgi:Trypsin-like peptidase domain